MVWVGAAIVSEKSSLKWMIQIHYQWKFEIQCVFVQRRLNMDGTSHRIQFSIRNKWFEFELR